LLLKAAVLLVVLLLSLVVASAWRTMLAVAGGSGACRAGALLVGGIESVNTGVLVVLVFSSLEESAW
jgi:hypothetical protein